MGAETKIQWTDATWNPVRGCSRVSEGCRNCYAEKVAARFSGPSMPYEGLAKDGKWTGKVRFIREHLKDPLKWKKPRRIFVNSISDIFHESLSDAEIGWIFTIMSEAYWHTFQVLTKRPERMHELLAGPKNHDDWPPRMWHRGILPNVWLGVSVEDQKTANHRIPILCKTPAAARFISAEPLLGPVSLFHEEEGCLRGCAVDIHQYSTQGGPDGPPEGVDDSQPCLDWVIVGGESGPDARVFNIGWARKIISECRRFSVPIFVKQLGSEPWESGPGLLDNEDLAAVDVCPIRLKDKKGGDIEEWPEDLRVREFPE